MVRRSLLALLLATALGEEECQGDTCASQEVNSASLLSKKSLMVRDVVSIDEGKNTSETCAALELPGFKLDGCEAVGVGKSCVASCPDGKKGLPVRYFCFKGLASEGKPPAALAPPLCVNSTGTSYPDGSLMAVEWEGKGCLVCNKAWSSCSPSKVGAKPGDSECTEFKVDREASLLRHQKWGMCFDMRGGPSPGLWRCNSGSSHQRFKEEESLTYPGTKALCVKSGRGKMCFNHLGRPAPFFNQKPEKSLFKSALDALSSGNSQTFLRDSYAHQICRAKLESGVPDDFWGWLKKQPMHTMQALFATFPAHPGHVRMFHAIREAVGHEQFEKLNMTSFAIALSWLNRMKGSIDEAVQMPHANFEINDAGFLAKDKDKVEQEMRDGKHCNIQSNQCRDLHKCCGKPDDWKFKWPRDPSPSVKEWVEFWIKKTAAHGEKLWMNPLNSVPWPFATYIWPSPVKECEWVHSKLIDNQPMEGKWYFYDHAFHKRVCAGGDYHPDALPGIAVYGGVCGRMAQLEWRKTSCMGKPATMKGEPGHCAGFKFGAKTGRYSTFNVLTDVTGVSTLQVVPEVFDYLNLEVVTGDAELPEKSTVCLKCKSSWKPCETAPAGSDECTKFTLDKELNVFRKGNQCLDMFSGPKPGLWRCSGGGHQKLTAGENHYTIKAGRGTFKIRTTDVPKEVHVPKCLKCSSWRACTEEAVDSPSCTQFYYDSEKSVFRPLGSSQCMDMRSGPKPGLWSCNYGGNQKATVNEAGNPVIKSGRGRLEIKRVAVKADESEKGRCIVCTRARSACTFATAGSEECTEFSYEEDKKRVSFGKWGQCLELFSGPRPGLYNCNGGSHQTVQMDDKGDLGFKSNRGKMTLHVADGGKIPEAVTRWNYEGIHEIKCTKRNCHYYDMLSLDSKTLITRKHKESALALFESFNNYEKQGLFPTAHDEARLAASMVYSLKNQDVMPAADLEPILAWALKRNPASYEAWELAASFNSTTLLTGDGMPSRDDLASHDWYKQLELLNLESGAAHKAAAESFARQHLLDHKKWLQLPQLRKNLVDRICGALSDGLLAELGEASEQCLILRRLAGGEGWQDAEDDMLEEDALCNGNEPSEGFQTAWEVLTRIAMAEGQHGQGEKLKKAVQYLLERLSIGYINQRSETFYAEYGRVLLSSPYAHVLQVAGAILPKEAREKILSSTRAVLEKPFDSPDRLRGASEALKDGFLAWAATKKKVKGAEEETSAADTVNGGSDGDSPNPEVIGEMALDKDEEMELGAAFWHEKEGNPDEDKKYEAEHLLKMLLRLHDAAESSPQSAAADGGLAASASLGQEVAEEAPAGPSPTELVQYCMDDLLAA